jgi:hypothetical protein
MSFKTWWAAHQDDAAKADTFIHKWPVQIVVVLVLCLLLSLCSNAKHAVFGSTTQQPSGAVVSYVMAAPAAYDEYCEVAQWRVEPAVQRHAYVIPRADGAAAFYVPNDSYGTTTLYDANQKGFHPMGDVYIDPQTHYIIVHIGQVYLGIKHDRG